MCRDLAGQLPEEDESGTFGLRMFMIRRETGPPRRDGPTHPPRALAGGWANESRLWLSRVRRSQGHAVEADAVAQVVGHEASTAGLARLAAAELG